MNGPKSDFWLCLSPESVDFHFRFGKLLSPIVVVVVSGAGVPVDFVKLSPGFSQLGLRILQLGFQLVLLGAGLVHSHLQFVDLREKHFDFVNQSLDMGQASKCTHFHIDI